MSTSNIEADTAFDNLDYLINRDVEDIYVPSTIYGVGGGGKEAVLQMFEQDWFAVEVMQGQSGTTNVYLVDTTVNEDQINDRITNRQQELNEIRDRMRETLSGEQIGGINLESVEITKGLKTDRASSLTGQGVVPDIKETAEIDHWWLERQDLIEPGTNDLYDFSKGACRCRAIGKAFHYKALAEGEDRGYNLNYTLPGDDDKVAIFAGLGGGTGSGLVIDIAKQLHEQNQARRTTLFATMPTRKEQVKERANAFAALSELEYQAFAEEDDIFDNIVLFPLQPLDPDIAVKDQELIEFDQALTYALIGYYNAGQYDDAVNQAPAYAPFTMALPQVFQYNIEGIVEARENAIETINRKITALNVEQQIYESVTDYIDKHYPTATTDGLKRSDQDLLKRRIEYMRELVELPLFEELEFTEAQTAGEKILNAIHDVDENEEEVYTDKSLEVAFAENDLRGLLVRELEFFFEFEYPDIDVESELDEVEDLEDETILRVILHETARIRDKYQTLKAIQRIPASEGGDESIKQLLKLIVDPSPATDESARVNAIQKHHDILQTDIDGVQAELNEVEEEIEAELHVQNNFVASKVSNWENTTSDDLTTYAELEELDVEDELEALLNALEVFASDLQQNKTPPSGERVQEKLDQLREKFEDIDSINFQNEYDQILQQIKLTKQLRRDWNQHLEAQNQGFTDKLNPLSKSPDPDSAKKELRATIVDLSEKVFETQHLGPNETQLEIDVTYDPWADGELVDRIKSVRQSKREAVVEEFERRLDQIAQQEGDGSYQAADVEGFRQQLDAIQDVEDLRRERENLNTFVNETYKETASEDLPDLEARRDELQEQLNTLKSRSQKYEVILDLYSDLRDQHQTFTEKHESFNEDINRQSERFGTRAFAEYQPNQHYIHKYMPQDTRRAIEKRSIAETDLFQKDWDQNERGRLQKFTSEIVHQRAAAPDYIGLREREFGNHDYDFTGTRVHVAKISEALDSSSSDKGKLWLDDLEVRDQLGRNYYLDESGQGRRMFEQWATNNGGPWDVALTFFVQGLGFLDNLRDVVEKRGYQDGYEARKREIHNIALHHSYGLEQGFTVHRREFLDPSYADEREIYLNTTATDIRMELCRALEQTPLSDDVDIESGPPEPMTYQDARTRATDPPAAEGDSASEERKDTAVRSSDDPNSREDGETASGESSLDDVAVSETRDADFESTVEGEDVDAEPGPERSQTATDSDDSTTST